MADGALEKIGFNLSFGDISIGIGFLGGANGQAL